MATPPAPPQSPRRRTLRAGDWLRITTVRIIVQSVTFALFCLLVLLTTLASLERLPGLRHALGKFLELDPLIALATALTTHTVYRGLLWSLLIFVPTLLLGRFFCNWICPFGTLHQAIGWLFRRLPAEPAPTAGARPSPDPAGANHPNRYRPSQRIKYYLLAALLAAAALGTLQVGLLDPLALLHRSLTGAALPAGQMTAPQLLGAPRLHQGAWLIGLLLLSLLAANLFYPRFFCRVLCPLGALLGLLSRWAWWRIERDSDRCQACGHCRNHCEGACDPDGRLRLAECVLCFNCLEDCPAGALRFAFLPDRRPAVAGPDLSRRAVLLAGVTGLAAWPLLRTTGRSTRDFSARAIRPPGALEELDFLARCLKCGQCIRICPTNVLQPAGLETGLEGLWTPVLNFRIGHCQLHCTACGHVCPSGALEPLSLDRKLGLGPFAPVGPLRLGNAHIDPGRCLPHSNGIPCQVCEEVCPTSPKAIYTEALTRTLRDGRPATLRVPRVDLDLCIGCGLCERECPVVGDRRAIYVTAEGETRSQHRPERDRNRSVRPPAAPRPGQRAC